MNTAPAFPMSIGFVGMTVSRHVAEAITQRLREGPHARHLRSLTAREAQPKHFQGKNVYVRGGALDWLKWSFAQTGAPAGSGAGYFPWRPPAAWDGQNLNVRGASHEGTTSTAGVLSYPASWPALSSNDAARARVFMAAQQFLAADVPRVIGGVFANGAQHGGTPGHGYPSMLAFSEVQTTQIGVGYMHPAFAYTANWAIGADYITAPSWVGGTTFAALMNHGMSYLRINAVGLDKGIYKVRHWDVANSRLYLANIDGSRWVAQTNATAGAVALGPGQAFFNQTSVIPNSVGTTTFDGVFAPGENRASYVFRLFFEKSGSPSPADASQKGTYWFMTRPYTFGDGAENGTETAYRDCGGLLQSRMIFQSRFYFPDAATYTALQAGWVSAGWVGSCPGMFLDRTNQRVWGASSNGTNGNIWWWLYKSPETAHEVATSTGAPNDPISGITMTGAVPSGLDGDDESSVYVTLYGGANAGVVKITNGLVATQWLSSSAALGANVRGLKIDKTRARTSAANTVTTTAGAGGNLAVTGMAFTQADVGRAIKIVGGVDAGTYLIATVTGATTCTVTTLAGAGVTFTGQAATGTAQIGSRIYLFWNDATSWAGTGGLTTIAPRYMESIAFGTVLKTADLTVTSGTGRNVYNGERSGAAVPVDVDAQNGNLYWVATDTATNVFRYDVTARTITQKALSTFTTPTGGAGTISTPTIVHAVGVNPHSAFREVWLATDQGWVKFSATIGVDTLLAASGNYSRYTGKGASTAYANPANYLRPDGTSWSTGAVARHVFFGIDGKVWGAMLGVGANGEAVTYNRDLDVWATAWDSSGVGFGDTTYSTGVLVTPYGEIVTMTPNLANSGALAIFSAPTCYQWISSAWTAQDVVRGALPDATSSPGLSCKDLHTTLDNLLYGVKVKFTPQGGATPANNEFVGRIGLTAAQRADGATTNASAVFTGSGFTSADVGRILRIEKSGGDTVNNADVDVYEITVYTNANTVTLQRVSGNGTAWAAAATGTCHYTVWDPGTYGPDCATVTAYNGFGKDNTQDVTNILYECFLGVKTAVSENVEGVKAACGIIGPVGSAGVAVYADYYQRATSPNYNPNIPQGLALGTPLTLGEQLLCGLTNMGLPDGTLGRVNKTNAPDGSTWGGISGAANSTQGFHYAVDFGADVEIGSVVVRVISGAPLIYTDTVAQSGNLANLHRALEAGGAPAAASVARLTGTGLTLASNSQTATLGAGDFIGAVTTGGLTDGVTTIGGNTITSAAGRFTGREGQVVRLTSGSDQGYYRITSVDGTGAIATVRALNQGGVSFTASAVGLGFDLYANATREDDILSIPSGVGTHKITVERLLTLTSAQVRVQPSATLTSQTWDALTPTWTLVKRCSHSVQATAPNTANNGTFVSEDGRERADLLGVANDAYKFVFDLSDFTAAQRTGRYWRYSLIPRFAASATSGSMGITSMEFYDPAGKRVDLLPNNRLDTVESLANFFAAHVQRIDWIQSANGACAHLTGKNGNCDVGGTNASVVTLNTVGNKFLGYQVRAGANLAAAGGNNTFTTSGGDPAFTAADVGRLLRVVAGANAGYYRISTVPTGASVTVTTPGGNAVTLAVDAGPTAWTLHEGINAGAASFDYITLGGVDYPLLTVSDDLTTLTLGVATFVPQTNVAWEIRRRAIPAGIDQNVINPTPAGVDATKSARIVYSATEFSRQVGDFVQDSKGTIAVGATDIGTPVSRADGTMAGGNGVFTGTGFTADDVNRILVIAAGANRGAYRISVYTSTTSITVVNARTGAAVTFAADAGPRSYKVVGERRFKISRYVSVLRQ
jgi:hypothetical protein